MTIWNSDISRWVETISESLNHIGNGLMAIANALEKNK